MGNCAAISLAVRIVGAEAGFDPLAITPLFERIASELLPLVADDVFRGSASGMNGACKEMRRAATVPKIPPLSAPP